MINKKSFLLIIFVISVFILNGCGDKKLDSFQNDMTQFKDNVKNISDKMDSIDSTSDTAITDLLTCLDEMNEQFQFLAAMEVPSKFSNIESLADEASTYMSEAVSLYHDFYESSNDDSVRQAASENYSRAMKRMNYISILLQGNIPDDTDVMVTEEDGLDFQPVTDIDEESEYNYDTETESVAENNSTQEADIQEDGPVKVSSKSN